jgi:general stress protein YciG
MARNDEHKGTSNRGFASMDQAKQRAIASKGGQSVPPEKRSFSQDPQLAAQAGRKGGESVPPEGRSFSQNRELAAEAGRKGGQARGAANRSAAARDQNGAKPEARRRAGDFDESREIAAEGARKASLPHDQEQPELGELPRGKDRPPTRAASPTGADNYGQGEELDERDELNAGNQDMESGELGQSPARPSDIGGKHLPHAR